MRERDTPHGWGTARNGKRFIQRVNLLRITLNLPVEGWFWGFLMKNSHVFSVFHTWSQSFYRAKDNKWLWFGSAQNLMAYDSERYMFRICLLGLAASWQWRYPLITALPQENWVAPSQEKNISIHISCSSVTTGFWCRVRLIYGQFHLARKGTHFGMVNWMRWRLKIRYAQKW